MDKPLHYFDPRNTRPFPMSQAGILSCACSLVVVPLVIFASVGDMLYIFRTGFVYLYWTFALALYTTAVAAGVRGLRDPRRGIAILSLIVDALLPVVFALRNTIWKGQIGWSA